MTEAQETKRQNFIARAWRGEERLKVIFFMGYFPFRFILHAALFFSFFIVSGPCAGSSPIYFYTVVLVLVTYLIWIYVSCWRCAFNAINKFYGYAVRAIIAFDLLGSIFFTTVMFF